LSYDPNLGSNYYIFYHMLVNIGLSAGKKKCSSRPPGSDRVFSDCQGIQAAAGIE